MQVCQMTWNENAGWLGAHDDAAQLVIYFGARETLSNATRFSELKSMFPKSHLVGCSTGGQISGDDVSDHQIAAVAMHFDATQLRLALEPVAAPEASRSAISARKNRRDCPAPRCCFLQIHDPKCKDEVVRTVLAIDRGARSMTFAGDVPQGWVAQLMRGNFDHLAQGAASAARSAQTMIGEHGGNNGVALMVSCIGRRLLMGQSITDEIEVAGKELGPRLVRIGLYSYGEISPHISSGACGLHNQTMTVTTITEAAA